MLELIHLSIIPAFLLIFARVIAFLMTVPLFSYRTIPTPIKVGLGFFLSLVILSSMEAPVFSIDHHFVLLLLKEVTVGLAIGLIAYIILSVVQIAGGFIDFQMGFAMANVMDPQTGAQSPIIGQFFYMIALLFLLSVNGHHLLIDGIYNSYQFIALDSLITVDGDFSKFIVETFNNMFIIAFQMALPLVGCLFLVDVALGIIARTVPQLNVFVVGLPLKILVSFIALSVFIILYMSLAKFIFDTMFITMRELMRILGGS